MPSVATDHILQSRLAVHVSDLSGNVALAARGLGLSPVFVWRFLRTGNAIERNKRSLREALDAAAQTGRSQGKKSDIVRDENVIEKRRAIEVRGMLRVMLQAMETYVEALDDVPGDGRPGDASGAARGGHDEQG